jgi:hypothetical protein
MYRPFKEFINTQFINGATTTATGYSAVKSLARGGGVTLRQRTSSGKSYFLVLQHVADREHVSLTGGWASRAWFGDWASAEMGYWHLRDEQRRAFVKALQTTPAKLVAESDEATFTAGQLDPNIVMHQLEVGDGGVPYEEIARTLLSQPSTGPKVEAFLGPHITQSLMDGNVPPLGAPNPALDLKDPYPITSRLLSWECWFEHVITRKPNEAELSALCGSTVRELSRQAELLLAVIRAMSNTPGPEK